MNATPRKKSTAAPRRLLQLRIELEHIRPMVWRRVVVPEAITLAKLHRVIQAAMGWTDSHLHEFRIGAKRYGMADPDFGWDEPPLAETRATLVEALGGAKSLHYVYDFGDDWRHRIRVEKILPPEAHPRVPLCIDGANACPPDDVGGPPGYDAFLEAMADPQNPEHEDMVEWWGEDDFDPDAFDLAGVNEALRRIRA